MSPLLSTLVVRLAELGEEPEVNHALSYGVGGIALGLLLALLAGLLVFGAGREHS
ncbi:MAG: hypothetical protein LH468_07020 [Nocardioides sp.]|nr:hypothetical protein [Nocardioides sp.]